eukprot:UN26563
MMSIMSWLTWMVTLGFSFGRIGPLVANGLPILSGIGAFWCWILGFGMIFYLCTLWLWTNWIYWRASHYFVKNRIDISFVADNTISKEMFTLLKQMGDESKFWAINHAIRFITTVIVAAVSMITA